MIETIQFRLNLRHINVFNEKVLQKLRDLWQPESGDVVYDGKKESALTDDVINDVSFNKNQYIPLLSLTKVRKIDKEHDLQMDKIPVNLYSSMEEFQAKKFIYSIISRYSL